MLLLFKKIVSLFLPKCIVKIIASVFTPVDKISKSSSEETLNPLCKYDAYCFEVPPIHHPINKFKDPSDRWNCFSRLYVTLDIPVAPKSYKRLIN